MMNIPNPARIGVAIAGLAVLGLGFYAWRKGGVAPAAAELGRQVPRVIIGAGVGAVEGVGEAVGIPRTNPQRCQDALRAGDMWQASFQCHAATFAQESWRRFRQPAVDQTILDPRDAQARQPAPGSSDDVSCMAIGCRDGQGPPLWDQAAIESHTWYGVP